MPKAIKKRVIKKIEAEEEVKGIVRHIADFIRQRKKLFILISSVLVIVIAITITFILYTLHLTKKAYSLQKEADNYYYNINLKTPFIEEERWKKALELYQQSLKVKPTPLVQFYIGNCYYRLNDFDNAVKAYTLFINKYTHEEGLLPLVYQRLSSSYIKSGKSEEALKTLQIFKNFKNGAFKDTALIGEARLYEEIGKVEDAKKIYREIIKGFPSSPWTNEAKSKTETKEKP